MRHLAEGSRVRAFAQAAAGPTVAQILGFLCELSGEGACHRYLDSRRRRGFPEETIMTRPEYERWRTEAHEENP
jgi:putative selenoprotein